MGFLLTGSLKSLPMKTIYLIILGIMVSSTLSLNAQTREIPLEDFFRNPEKSAYQISPNGKYYSYLAPYENRMNIFVQKIGKEKADQLTFETDRDIAGYLWGNNDRILYLKDEGGDENFSLFGVDLNGKNLKCLTCFENVRTTIIDDLTDIEEYMIIGMNKRNPQVFDPYRLNIQTGEMEMIFF